jgi:hypothetical protein
VVKRAKRVKRVKTAKHTGKETKKISTKEYLKNILK